MGGPATQWYLFATVLATILHESAKPLQSSLEELVLSHTQYTVHSTLCVIIMLLFSHSLYKVQNSFLYLTMHIIYML